MLHKNFVENNIRNFHYVGRYIIHQLWWVDILFISTSSWSLRFQFRGNKNLFIWSMRYVNSSLMSFSVHENYSLKNKNSFYDSSKNFLEYYSISKESINVHLHKKAFWLNLDVKTIAYQNQSLLEILNFDKWM